MVKYPWFSLNAQWSDKFAVGVENKATADLKLNDSPAYKHTLDLSQTHSRLQGMATNFIIEWSIERGGIFPQDDVPTLCRLAGWSESSGAWRLYIKDLLESNLDTSGLMYKFEVCCISFIVHIFFIEKSQLDFIE